MSDSNVAPLGYARFSAYDLLPMSRFDDVAIMPSTGFVDGVPNGGPVLPEWVDQYEVREGQGGVPLPMSPADPTEDIPQKDESLVWGGSVARSMDRMISETAVRAVQASRARPDDRIVFTLWPGGLEEETPALFWEMMAWYGIPEDRIVIADQPMRARTLWIAPQAEQNALVGPSYAYLELLADLPSVQAMTPKENRVVFVARAHPQRADYGLWFGDAYLIETLKGLGVSVLDPDGMSLQQRMAIYAGAQTLICAEGGAAVARQLLGYRDQDIVVLTRTPEERRGLHLLTPRARTVSFAEVTQDRLHLLRRDGQPFFFAPLSVFDEVNLFRIFAAYGVALKEAWNEDRYKAAVRASALTWFKYNSDQEAAGKARLDWAASAQVIGPVLERLGIDLTRDAEFTRFFKAEEPTG